MTKDPSELKPETLINRVMSGKKDYKSNDYLIAFSKIPANELHSSKYSRFDIISLWNSLHSCNIKTRYFTMSLVRDNKIVQDNIRSKFVDAKYAWILHDKDSTEHKHFHYVIIFPNPRSLKSIANDLELPYTMVDKVRSKRGILDYLTHENNPNKHHYPLEDVFSNFDVNSEKNDPDSFDPIQEFEDYCALREGRMSREEWFDKYSQLFYIVRH